MRRCPCCGQALPELRLGVRLPPLKLRIYDLIRRAGRDGIRADDLRAIVYDANVPRGNGIREQRSSDTIRSHINQINDLLSAYGTGFRISAGRDPRSYYRLIRVGP